MTAFICLWRVDWDGGRSTSIATAAGVRRTARTQGGAARREGRGLPVRGGRNCRNWAEADHGLPKSLEMTKMSHFRIEIEFLQVWVFFPLKSYILIYSEKPKWLFPLYKLPFLRGT